MGDRCLGWCGACYENRRGRSNHRHHVGYRPPRPYREEAVGSVLRRRLETGSPAGTPGGMVVCPLLDAVPGVREMLTETRYPDGSPRQTSTLLVFLEEGIVKCCLNDRDQAQTAWASGGSVADCLGALEAGLQRDSLQWRSSGPRKGGKRGK